MSELVLLIVFWVIYYALHSVLAASKVKLKLQKASKLSDTKYRLCYSILSTIGLLAIFFYLAQIKSDALFPKTPLITYFSLMLTTFGVIVINLAIKRYGLFQFLGLKEAKDENPTLQVDGILGKVRHPIYSGTILLGIGLFLFIPTLAVFVSMLFMLAYLIIGIKLEEQKLIEEFGDKYQEYKRNVPSIIPKIKI